MEIRATFVFSLSEPRRPMLRTGISEEELVRFSGGGPILEEGGADGVEDAVPLRLGICLMG